MAEVLDNILQRVEDHPGMITREVFRAINVPYSIFWRVLANEGLHPYHVKKVQASVPADYAPDVEFPRWFFKQLAAQPEISAHALFTDENTFTREDISNTHNFHVWASSNIDDTRPLEYQKCFWFIVWAAILDNQLIGPYLLSSRLDNRTYLTFVQQVMPELLQPVPPHLQGRI